MGTGVVMMIEIEKMDGERVVVCEMKWESEKRLMKKMMCKP